MKNHLHFEKLKLLCTVFIFLLFACGDKPEESCVAPTGGQFIEVRSMGTIDIQFINDLRPSFGIPESFTAKYDVDVYAVNYATTDPDGKEAIATGAIYIPKTGNDDPLSLLSGQHGLTIKKRDVPSTLPLYGYLGLFGAAKGYASVQADYLGLGNSDVQNQPVNQKSSAVAVVDLIDGMRHYACENDIPLNENVFLLGYSTGGYVSMAVHHELNENPRSFVINASVMVAGYFDLNISESFQIADTLYRPAWALYSPFMYDQQYQLGLMDKMVESPHREKLNDLFNGEKDASEIDKALTPISKNLFTDAARTSFGTHSDFASFRQVLSDNSLNEVVPQSPVLFIHSKEDGAVDFEQSVN
ncbi:MAG TPA: hypothetical protein EYO54_05035, partial [Candidatus Marinimicrobia bacterium]|nr:hypothetical protein [Candidatus Neomarinimicrobiota bacterium]